MSFIFSSLNLIAATVYQSFHPFIIASQEGIVTNEKCSGVFKITHVCNGHRDPQPNNSDNSKTCHSANDHFERKLTEDSRAVSQRDSGIGLASTLTYGKTIYSKENEQEFLSKGAKFHSLPFLQHPRGYQHVYNSQNFPVKPLLNEHYPAKQIKCHKFGSVITLKERSLLGGGHSLGLLCDEDKSQAKPKPIARVLLACGLILLLVARVVAFYMTSLLIGPWIYMTACKDNVLIFPTSTYSIMNIANI